MKRYAVIMGLLLAGLAAWGEQEPRDARALMEKGITAFEGGDPASAEAAFGDAAEAAKDEKLDPAVPTYNRGVALLEQGLPEQASSVFEEALHTGNLELQSRAYYNRGNAIMSTVEPQLQQEQLQPALDATTRALEMYERAISLAPADVDAKANFELAQQKKKQIEMLIEQQPPQQQQQNQDSSEDQSQDENRDQQQQQQQQDQQDQNEQQQQQPQPDEGEDQQGQENQPQPQEAEDGEEQQQQSASEEMTEEEAKMLLEAMKEEEAAARERMRLQLGPPSPVSKDW
jgi:cobalamin biosynthesis protein CobT